MLNLIISILYLFTFYRFFYTIKIKTCRKNLLKIAIIRLSALGDIVHTSIVLQFIKKHFKDAKISWFVDKRFETLLQNNKFIDEIVSLPLKDKKFICVFKILSKFNNKFDFIIDFQGLIKSAIISRMLGKNTAGFDKFSSKEWLSSLFYKTKISCSYDENIIIRNLTLASKVLNFSFTNDEIDKKDPCFAAEDVDFKFCNNYQKKVLIAPFASEKSKCYDKFKEVIKALDNCQIFISNWSENEKNEAINLSKNTHAEVLKKMNLRKMINFISKMDLVIGNDSGITHLAWALNRPSITLFGNRPSYRNAYVTKKNITLDTKAKIDAKNINKNDFCINEIKPEIIVNEAKRLLEL